VRTYPTIAMKVCTFVPVTNVINRANFGGCMLRGLVSAKGRIWAFPIGADMSLTTVPCATALTCDNKYFFGLKLNFNSSFIYFIKNVILKVQSIEHMVANMF
jgi:hypothetical protein